MSGLSQLAWRSAWSRRYSLSWVALSIALATFLMLTLEQLRQDVRTHFAQSVSGTDLIVGARTSSTALLLYSVFRIGNATHNIRWSSAQALANDPAVAWVIPISLGDSFMAYPVVATNASFFEHFRYGERQALSLAQGRAFSGVFEAVLGAEVAQRLQLKPGQAIGLSHGSGAFSAVDHSDKPFTIVGVLARTGTPVDRSVHIGLDGMQAIHLDWVAGMPARQPISAEQAREMDLTPTSVTALLVGLKSRAAVFSMQRSVSQFAPEPLMAVLPGVALDELWTLVGVGERVLELMVLLVAAVSLLALVATISAGLEQRRRELAVLRSLGAGPGRIFALLLLEGTLVTTAAAGAGVLATALALSVGGQWLSAHYGITVQWRWLEAQQWLILAGVWLAGILASAWPGWRAYRLSVVDGLQPRN
jgi:putative ABC transport system permease protein